MLHLVGFLSLHTLLTMHGHRNLKLRLGRTRCFTFMSFLWKPKVKLISVSYKLRHNLKTIDRNVSVAITEYRNTLQYRSSPNKELLGQYHYDNYTSRSHCGLSQFRSCQVHHSSQIKTLHKKTTRNKLLMVSDTCGDNGIKGLNPISGH